MPIKDYYCLCGETVIDRIEALLSAVPPECSVCKIPMSFQWGSIVRRPKPFEAFEFDADNGERVLIDSLAKLRDVERKSNERFEKGAGRPFVFRAYSNDVSNHDANVFGAPPNYRREMERSGRMNRIESGSGEKAKKYFT